MNILINFNKDNIVREEPVKGLDKLDMRTMMVARNPTEDFVMMRNYMQVIQSKFNSYKRYCMIDIGFLPVVMCPTFCDTRLYATVIAALEQHEIPYYFKFPIYFEQALNNTASMDVWVSRLDLKPYFKGNGYLTAKVSDVWEVLGCC